MAQLALARFTATARLLIGGGFLVAPGLAMRPWIGDAAAHPSARLLARAVGARDVALALGTLGAARRGALRPWLAAALLADATDLALTVAQRDRLPARGRLVSAIAGAGVALGALAFSLRPSSAPGS